MSKTRFCASGWGFLDDACSTMSYHMLKCGCPTIVTQIFEIRYLQFSALLEIGRGICVYAFHSKYWNDSEKFSERSPMEFLECLENCL